MGKMDEGDHWNDIKVFSGKFVLDLKHVQIIFGHFSTSMLDGRTEGRTDGWTNPLIEMHG